MGLTQQELYTLFRQARPLNLGIATLVYATSTFLLTHPHITFLTHWKWYVEGILVVMIMASGYWLNDLFDLTTDSINKPHKNLINKVVPTKKVLSLYFAFTLLIMLLSLLLNNFPLFLLNGLTIFMLYAYSARFQKVLFLGNGIISLLCALLVLVPSLLGYGWNWIQIWLAATSFWLTFLREVVKDVIDMKGDLEEGYFTLPIRIGIRATKAFLKVGYAVLFLLWVIPLFFISPLSRLVYGLSGTLTVLLPLLWSFAKLHSHSHPEHFRIHSHLLKGSIFGGLLCAVILKVYH